MVILVVFAVAAAVDIKVECRVAHPYSYFAQESSGSKSLSRNKQRHFLDTPNIPTIPSSSEVAHLPLLTGYKLHGWPIYPRGHWRKNAAGFCLVAWPSCEGMAGTLLTGPTAIVSWCLLIAVPHLTQELPATPLYDGRVPKVGVESSKVENRQVDSTSRLSLRAGRVHLELECTQRPGRTKHMRTQAADCPVRWRLSRKKNPRAQGTTAALQQETRPSALVFSSMCLHLAKVIPLAKSLFVGFVFSK